MKLITNDHRSVNSTRPPGAPPDFANYASLGIPPAIGSFAYDPATDAVGLTWPAADPRLGDFLATAQQTLKVMDRSNGSLTLSFNPAGVATRSVAPSWARPAT